jgi:acyl carrier protein
MGNDTNVSNFIIDFFIARGVDVTYENSNEIFFMDGLIDSFEVMSLLISIEQDLNVRISPIELLEKNNRTILGLIKLVVSKIN